jgi:phosphatidylethanolamine/phosphatidyl-N-methylethanolamine N-methyltransferase
VKFVKEFIWNPMSIGAIAPSSAALARTMVDGLNLRNAEAVLEYGPGTGAFTGHILRDIGPKTKFAAIELNSQFAAEFRLRYPKVSLFEDSVENARAICDSAGIAAVDCIVSGLPWATFPEKLQLRILDQMMKVLKPGGSFVTFGYLHAVALPPARKFARLLPRYFSSVSKSSAVWLNLPPAFAYRCHR